MEDAESTKKDGGSRRAFEVAVCKKIGLIHQNKIQIQNNTLIEAMSL